MIETRFGFPEEEFLPAELEYARGLKLLEGMELKGLVAPVTILVSDMRGQPLVTPERAAALISFIEKLRQDPASRVVIAPNILAAARPLPFPVPENGATISADDARLIVRVVPHDRATLTELRELSQNAPNWLGIPDVAVDVGGQASYYNDFDRAVRAVYPQVFGAVLGLSALALLLMFRAPLVAAKALLLNLMSVAAGYGVVVWVFQLGNGAALFGLATGTEAIPATVPLVIFAILFGVSMDYEIFLLTRVRALFMASGDHGNSLVEGLADTGTVITSAALVMVGVFGAFAFAKIVVVQMIGLGLAVAVLADATLIRSLLGPALMQLAGKWNWWPLSGPVLK
jgi:RND superfamily putative drug exporter